MKITKKITITNEDNMELMARYPDGYFDLAIVDPPYGIGIDGQKKYVSKNPKHNRKNHDKKNWDSCIPSINYFKELFRVSRNQIVWGGNYFTEFLNPTKAWIFWYKGQNDLTMSDGEMAWTSFDKVTRQININRAELIKQKTFHPTEKPIKLYKWLLDKYAKPGDKILDTHLGSGSIAIACYDYGFELTACELDTDYYRASIERITRHIAFNQSLFSPEQLNQQNTLFQ
ncbi:DNA methyltransferase [Chryseobacterium sediminis]|uniref:site-specific DNA-methyltransferase (adenine-specific) n=1 Tax=Chryseobacterium sediminis TaxID=1679494 RepID=A0A5B2U8Q4_9FLAO|nr:DNA methyltransferase [Chryseobacterium sediminis]KAA2223004.1 site-specific DNA-methyltransferase [Chryseobacterium sediminis]